MEPKRPKGASIMQPETLLYPVRVRGDLDLALSRWQWLVKWILAIPHWAIRVRAYASLMRDEYPPFRLDMGPREPEPPAAPESA
jgi:hypothetical protein